MSELRDYQTACLEAIRTAAAEGCRRQLVSLATGLGKAQPVDELVLTPDGWRTIGSIAVGDFVYGPDGKPTRVLGVFPQGDREVWKVCFSDGSEVRCDADHLWTVRDKYGVFREARWRDMTTRAIAASVRRKWRVPIVEPVEFPEAEHSLDPYLLGVLLGDGGLSVKGRVLLHTEHELALSITLPAPCRMTLQREDGTSGRAGTYIIGGNTGRSRNPVLSGIRELGLEGSTSRTKFIPKTYLHASVSQRLELLRGIMDADGHVRPKDNHVELTSVSWELASGVRDLVESLGGTATIVEKRTSWTYEGEKKFGSAFRLSIQMSVNPFRWKAARWKPRAKYAPIRQIVAAGSTGVSREQVCLLVAHPTSLYVTARYVVTHNTVIFANLPKIGLRRLLIVAHREELLGQAAEKLRHWNPGLHVAIDQAERKANIGALRFYSTEAYAICASIATIGRSGSPRLTRYQPTDFDAVVVDEAHHCAAASYLSAIRHLRAGQPGGPLLLGVTATPFRADGEDLAKIFERVVFEHDVAWGIGAGHLVDIRALQVETHEDLSKVAARRDDFVQGDLAAAVNTEDRNARTVRAYLDKAADRKALVFAAGLDHSKALARQFQAAGVPAEHLDGETETGERRAILRRLASGQTRVLCNMGVLTEGFDEPSISCIVMARPTKSSVLYTQMIGRGTRPAPGKQDLLVIDMADMTGRHSTLSTGSLFGLPPKLNLKGASAVKARQKVEEAMKVGLPFETVVKARSLEELQALVNRYSELARVQIPTVPADIAAVARMRWVPLLGGGYGIAAGGRSATAKPDLLGRYHVVIVVRETNPDGGRPTERQIFGGEFGNARLAIQRSEQELAGQICRTLTDPGAAWRNHPASEKQLEALSRARVPHQPGITKGQANDLLTMHYQSRTVAR